MTDFNRHSGDSRPDAASLGSGAFMGVLAEMVPVPVIIFDAQSAISIANRLASQMMVVSPDRLDRRIVTFDGTDLWDVIEDKRRQGELLDTEIPVRIRTASTRFVDVVFIASTFGGEGGEGGGVFLIAYDSPDDRDGVERHPHPLDGTLQPQGEDFGPIVRLLAETLGVDAAVFAELDPDRPLLARTIAAFQDGAPVEGFEWSLAGTPVVTASGKRSVTVQDSVRTAFPEDAWAAAEGFESFSAVFLNGIDERRTGVLAVYSRDPIASTDATNGILRLFAMRLLSPLRHLVGNRALQESEERYSTLFQRSHLPMLLLDPVSTQIVDANDAACEFYGYSYDEITSMSILQVNTLPAEDAREELRRAGSRHRDYFRFHHRLADGTVRDVEAYTNPIVVHSRELVFEIVHDVTDQRRIESELERYKQQLETLVQRRTDDLMRTSAELQQATAASEAFYENVGAEFRTPLHTIIGFSDMLVRGLVGELSDEQTLQIGMINDAARALEALMGDVLELSRIDTGVESCDPEEFDLVELVASVVVGAGPAAGVQGLELTVVTPEHPIDVLTDRNKVEQVLLQLLSNALKYTHEGSVRIELTEPDADTIAISVTDTGVGIEAQELPHIFEEFRQVARHAAGTHEGTGLGLAVCRRLMGILGGTIDVQSERGEGSVFTLTAPRRCV